jgi:hypothetical protein
MPSAYEVLGVPRDLAPDELRRAYRELVRVWHPDRFQGEPRLQAEATERLKEISAAYQAILSERRHAGSEAPGTATRRRRARPWGPNPGVRAWMAEVSRRLPYHWSRWALGAAGVVLALAGIAQLQHLMARPVPGLQEPAARRRLPESATALVEELNRGLAASPTVPAGTDARAPASGPPGVVPALSAPERPPNGAELTPARHGLGRGELTLTNETAYDAEVKLVMAGAARELSRHVFIHALTQHTVRGLPPGSYELLFRAGEEWKPAGRRFTRIRAVGRLDRPLRWEEVETATEVRYQKRQVSLRVGPSPESGLSPIGDDEFGKAL